MFKGIDLFSDTGTLPTEDMKRAMFEAPLGDEQRAEDPTTRHLESKMAELLGKESALFFPSATMANQVALAALGGPGDEVIAAHDSHIFSAETGGPAMHARLQTRPIESETGLFSGADVRRVFRYAKGPLQPVSRIVCIENTTNFGGGYAWPLDTLDDVVGTTKELGMSLHMDGSRLFNAAVRLEVPASRLTSAFDTVTVCLSKGLGCPAGAVLGFDPKRFHGIRRLKQQFGGSLRQSGILAAAGLFALENNIRRLADDHNHARTLAEGLSAVSGITVENGRPSTNMVFFRWEDSEVSGTEFARRCEEAGVRFSQFGENRFRAVTHLSVSAADIEKAIAIVRGVAAGFGRE